MKNLTEFPGFLLRRASAVRSEKLQELLAAAKTAPAAEPESDAPAVDDSSEATDTVASEASPAEEVAASPETAEESDKSTEAAAESDKTVTAEASDKPADDKPKVDEEALAAAVGEVMKVADERLTYLMGALQAVGRKGIDKVRQVRVFKGEEAPAGAFSIDDLHFVVDRIASPAKKSSGDNKGRGNKGRGNKGGGGGGGSGFKPSSPKAGQGFDSMARDERPGDVPSGGLGWSLERVPGADKDKRGPGRGKPGRKGPKRGKPGKPGEKRNDRRPRSGGAKKAPEVVVKATTVAPSDK